MNRTSRQILTRQYLSEFSPVAVDRYPVVVFFDSVGSTNETLWRVKDKGGHDGTVVLAGVQEGGRGRLGRVWESPPGNLYLSLLRRIVEPMGRASMVSLLAGVALARAVEDECGTVSALKWPNDLLVDGLKAGGILLEGREGWQVVGIGLNVNAAVEEYSEQLRPTITTLSAISGRKHDIQSIAARVLAHFFRLEEAFVRQPGLPAEYARFFPFVGSRVKVVKAGSEHFGIVREVGDDGALVIAEASGELRRITSGEVLLVRNGNAEVTDVR